MEELQAWVSCVRNGISKELPDETYLVLVLWIGKKEEVHSRFLTGALSVDWPQQQDVSVNIII